MMPYIYPTSASVPSTEGRWPRICEQREAPPALHIAMLSLHTSPMAAVGKSRDAGGMNVYIRELARHLGNIHTSDHTITVDIFTRWTDPSLPAIIQLSPNTRLIHIAAGPIASVHKNDLFAFVAPFVEAVADFAELQPHQYDVVHSHYWLSGCAGMELSQQWDVPHVVMFHTLARLKQSARPAEQETLQRIQQEEAIIATADTVIVATQDEYNQISRLYGKNRSAFRIIPGGVDLQRFTDSGRESARSFIQQQLQLADQPIVLFVGRLDPLKDPELLLRARQQMQQSATLIIVGGDANDPERARLQQLAETLGIADHVRFVDAVVQEELAIYYRAADILAIASHYESFGLAAVEAMACGTPVIAPSVGGLPVIVHDGCNGVLLQQRTSEAFAETIDGLIDQPEQWQQLAYHARHSVIPFAWSSIACRVFGLYTDLTVSIQPALRREG